MNRIESRLLPGAPNPADGYLRRPAPGTICGYLQPGAPNPTDGYLRRWSHAEIGTAGGPAFPTQFAGFKVRKAGVTIELCMVATADAPTGMGGQLRVRRTADTVALYLVETADPNASPVRVQTATGIKAVRLKT